MLLLFAFFLFLLGACLIFLLPAIWAAETYRTYHDARPVDCPETHVPVGVTFDAAKAAWTSLSGPPQLRLANCTRWPERGDCGQECIPDALRHEPTPVIEHVPWRSRRIVHAPVLVASAAAWVLGMAWHSEYLFRFRWMDALGLSDHKTRVLAEMWSPHLLSIGALVLFAYGVAGLLRWLGTRTLVHGVEVSTGLWLIGFGAVLAAVWAHFSPTLLWIEGGYTLLAALLIGAIVGGAPRWIFMGDRAAAL